MRSLILSLALALCAPSLLSATACTDYACDSLAVRAILDANGLTSTAVTSVTTAAGSPLRIITLQLSAAGLTTMPADLGDITQLVNLYLSFNSLTSLPNAIGNLTQLKILWAYNNQFTSLPAGIGALVNMVDLRIADNDISSLPDTIGNLEKVRYFSAGNNALTSFSNAIGNMDSLRVLELAGNSITSIPDTLGNLTKDTVLLLEFNAITSLPNSIGRLTELKKFWAYYNLLTSLPNGIGALSKLEELKLGNNDLTSLPDTIRNLRKLRIFEIYNSALTSFSLAIGRMDSLRNLLLEGNNGLGSIPDTIRNLKKLEQLYVQFTGLTALPATLCSLSNLQTLYAYSNDIATLPNPMHRLTSLLTLRLDGNELTTLPIELTGINLTSLNVSSNKICCVSDSLADWLSAEQSGWSSSQTCSGVSCGPLVYYMLNDSGATTAYDSSGNNRNATIYGSPAWVNDINGNSGKACSLNVRTRYIEHPHNSAFDITNRITISAWVKVKNVLEDTGRTFVCKGSYDNIGPSQRKFWINYRFLIKTNTKRAFFQYVDSNGVGLGSHYHGYLANTAAPNFGDWHHYVVTNHFGVGSSIKIYVDGAEVGGNWSEGNGNTPAAVDTFPLTIGAMKESGNGNHYYSLKGVIDEVQIWNRVLDGGEILDLYTSEPAAKKFRGTGVAGAVPPTVFALHQNLPNPFNPSTAICYDVPQRKRGSNLYPVRLTIYNAAGQAVGTVVDKMQDPGYYTVQWDGRDTRGRMTPTGMYFYVLKSNGFVARKKMVMVK